MATFNSTARLEKLRELMKERGLDIYGLSLIRLGILLTIDSCAI
jgi:hypothetical protein